VDRTGYTWKNIIHSYAQKANNLGIFEFKTVDNILAITPPQKPQKILRRQNRG